MAHQALYRKYRPLNFDDVVEQAHVVNTLRNIVLSGKIAHAYLFSGTRGTGKTTMAKIFARAVNCLQPINGNPCNTCTVCHGILDGTVLDVIEIDAASNNSVDNVRGIIDEVGYTPTQARIKVYIIDEVHMLSTGAFNALLKTLEEPPKHVMFILATTEPHKLPATVLSRCQRFDFRRISVGGIVQRLMKIAEEAGVNLTQDALEFIGSLAEGALRDGISILDQCIATGKNPLVLEDIHEIVGIAPNKLILDTADFLIERNGKAAVEAIDLLITDGKDPGQFLQGLVQLFRDILVYQTVNSLDPLHSMSGEDRMRIPALASKTSPAEALAVVRELSELEAGIRWSSSPRILLEMTFLRICTREITRDKDDLSYKLNLLEERIRKLEQGIPVRNADASFERVAVKTNESTPELKPADKEKRTVRPVNKTGPEKTQLLNAKDFKKWEDVMADLKKGGHMVILSYLFDSRAVWKDENTIWIILPEGDVHKEQLLNKSRSIDIITDVIRQCTGKKLKVELYKTGTKEKTQPEDEIQERILNFAKKTGLEVDIVDS